MHRFVQYRLSINLGKGGCPPYYWCPLLDTIYLSGSLQLRGAQGETASLPYAQVAQLLGGYVAIDYSASSSRDEQWQSR
jgi:hypothetical protein